jgi:hypothetical protein
LRGAHKDSASFACSGRHVYYAGFHLPGACTAKGRDWNHMVFYEDSIRVNDAHAAMFHYRNKLNSGSPYMVSPWGVGGWGALRMRQLV